jgi:hypothetical protein
MIRKTRQISTLTDDRFSSGRESSLHSAIKKWYLLEGDKPEAKVEDFTVDIVRGDLLIEIQTANLAVKPKLSRLLNDHKVRIVYPIPREKWIIHKSMANGEISGRRRSPKKGRLSDLFSESIRISSLVSNGNLSVEVLMIEMEEIWRDDGRGSWRRRGASIEDRRHIRVLERKVFESKADFLEVLPKDLPDPFSSADLAESLGIRVGQSRRARIGSRRSVENNRNKNCLVHFLLGCKI